MAIFREVFNKGKSSYAYVHYRHAEDKAKTHVLNKLHGKIQGGSNMTGTNCDLFTHKYLNHLVCTID
jgi:hypothetical protein